MTVGPAWARHGFTVTSSRFRGAALLALLLPWADTGAAQAPRWTLRTPASVVIGNRHAAGDDLFLVTDATVLPDGRIVVLNSGSHQVRIYSSTGSHLASYGRAGDGPGDFRNPRSVRVVSVDTFVIHDQGLSRLTRMTAAGGIVETLRVDFPADPSAAMPAPANLRPFRSGLRPFTDGTLPVARLGRSIMDSRSRATGPHTDSLILGMQDGSFFRTIFRGELGPMFDVAQGSARLTAPIPFGPLTLFATGPAGVVVGNSHATLFELLGVEGPAGRYVAEGALRRATRNDRSAFEEQFRRQYGSGFRIGDRSVGGQHGLVERILSEAPRGEYLPFFDLLVLDSEGYLWVREYLLESDTASWQVVDQQRGVIARLEMPARWIVLEIGKDYVLVKDRDDLDVEIIKKVAISRSER